MDNAEFRKLLVSSAEKGDGEGEQGGGKGKGGGGFAGFKRRKNKVHTDYVAKGEGGRVDRHHLKEAMEREARIKAQKAQGGRARRYDEDEDEDEEGGGGGRRHRKEDGFGEIGNDGEDETAPNGGVTQHGARKGEGGGGRVAGGASEEGGYRDRAEERRKGVNPDYEDEIARLVHMDAETTKYLGGDVKHTHLVKGLDYALLQRVRAGLKEGEGEGRKEEGQREGKEEGEDKGGMERRRKSLAAAQSRTLLGKSLQAFLVDRLSGVVRPVEAIRRLALEYDLAAHEDGGGAGRETGEGGAGREGAAGKGGTDGLPTMMMRSKLEMEREEEARPMLYRLPPPLLTRLQRALETYRQVAAGLKKRGKKRHRAEETYAAEGNGGSGVDAGNRERKEGVRMGARVKDVLGWGKGRREGGKEGGEEGQGRLDADVARLLGDAGIGEGRKGESGEGEPVLFGGSERGRAGERAGGRAGGRAGRKGGRGPVGRGGQEEGEVRKSGGGHARRKNERAPRLSKRNKEQSNYD
ncbi:hypothetical protein NSK_008044 [Nannochloropsis salina CCMP1776]|uniref:RED-like N-terminal domain-containing protein n=1 Tax=Nannochloropsis salina CCMP1776 TaxID=1027361 RepID=A0A4D9CVF8_9STRA|nr:hypothetical protein NSK_008044 [Nannochloropsis salina CCMP1776]|eukprot:TFJ80618.1 hypothetical protein NSK_008044 [Nannochloropsis salina CCMP1776]